MIKHKYKHNTNVYLVSFIDSKQLNSNKSTENEINRVEREYKFPRYSLKQNQNIKQFTCNFIDIISPRSKELI